jgi:roadblock/LC7 domain-containing protein
MAILDELLEIEGVIAAGEFTRDGMLVDYKAKIDLSPELAAMIAQLCAPVDMMFETLAEEFMRFTNEMRWLPPRRWAYSGGDWTVAVAGNRGVFVETAKADFNDLFRVLDAKQ